MNRNIILKFGVAAAGICLLWSCDKEQKINYDDYIGSETNASGAYFPESYVQKSLGKDDTSVVVEIARTDATNAQTVSLRKLSFNEILEGIFTVPESVDFQAGQKTAEIEILVEQEGAPKETFLNVEIGIADEDLYNYGNVTLTLSVSIAADWKLLGTGYYNDSVVYDWEIDDPKYLQEITVWQREDAPEYFKISDPYIKFKGTGTTTEDFGFSIMQIGDVVEGPYFQGPWSYQWPDVTVTLPNLILTTQWMTFYDTYYEEPGYIQLPVQQFLTGECWPEYGEESGWVYNYVESYQDDGLPAVIKLSPVIFYDPDEVTELGYFWYNYTGVQVVDTDYDVTYEVEGSKIITIYFPGVETPSN